ncbi:MAG TPA: hypothetical protein VEB43_04590 [Anaeromyxobacter sp.]|nr:hypothetical protein [Anaeromyxobacter sp.]
MNPTPGDPGRFLLRGRLAGRVVQFAFGAAPYQRPIDPGDGADLGLHLVAGRGRREWEKGQLLQLGAHELGREVAIAVEGEPHVCVAEDAAHRREGHPGLEEEARAGVPQVVEADRPDLRDRPELVAVNRTAAEAAVWSRLGVLAAGRGSVAHTGGIHASAADVPITRDEAGAAEGAA